MVERLASDEKTPVPTERERKFLVKSLPEGLFDYEHVEIRQGYLAIEDGGREVRLRQKGDKYFQTVKDPGDEVRPENEIELTEEQFESLWGMTIGRRVEKTRWFIPHGNLKFELDIYGGELANLNPTVEVEFADEDQSHDFDPPDWFGEEVTSNKKLKNQQLALHGIPKGYEVEEELLSQIAEVLLS